MTQSITLLNKILFKLGSVADHVIQANGRLSFEDDLRSESLVYCFKAICTELADSMATLGEPRELLEKEKFELVDTSSSSKNSWREQ